MRLSSPCLVGSCLSTLLPCLKERQANQHSLGAVGNFESVGHGNIIHLGPHFTIIGLGVPLSQPPSQVSNMKIHYPNLPLKMQLVHYIHGWWGKIIAMNLKIYETAQNQIASRNRSLNEYTVYCIIDTSNVATS